MKIFTKNQEPRRAFIVYQTAPQKKKAPDVCNFISRIFYWSYPHILDTGVDLYNVRFI